MFVVRKTVSLFMTGLIACVMLAACHGSSSTQSTSPPTISSFTCPVSGFQVNCSTVFTTADSGTSTVTWNFGDSATASGSGTADAAAGAGFFMESASHTYTAPGTYTIKLTVTDDHGTITTLQQNVAVTGGNATGLENWNWINGSKYINSYGDFATSITFSAANQPSSRQGSATWVSQQGKLWLFGGNGYDSTGLTGMLNDLWEFDPTKGTSGEWAWIGGSNKANVEGTYGTMNQANPSNSPGARSGAASWVDNAGNFWLFGGNGYDASGTQGSLGDMWKINPLTGEATWITGTNFANAAPSASAPTGRFYATTWKDTSGNFWLFGGQTNLIANLTTVALNDLWMYNPTTNVWKLMSGSPLTNNTPGVYGTAGTAASTNVPGARISGQGWVDNSGTLWLFGGNGYDSVGSTGILNDMWSFNPTTKAWTWVGGANVISSLGNYGSQGVAAASNIPAARAGSVGWTDATGLLWMFGGGGYTSTTVTTAPTSGSDDYNDLWNFNPTTKLWTWMGGVSTTGSAGVFPNANSTSTSPYNTPGAREWSAGWLDTSGKFWLFGGYGLDASGATGNLSDFWSVQPSP